MTMKIITAVALVLAMVSTLATAGSVPQPQLRPAHELPCTEYLDDAELNHDNAYKCAEDEPDAPQITCDQDKWAVMFADHKYHCAWPSEMWIEMTPEERGAFDPNAGPSEE